MTKKSMFVLLSFIAISAFATLTHASEDPFNAVPACGYSFGGKACNAGSAQACHDCCVKQGPVLAPACVGDCQCSALPSGTVTTTIDEN